MKRIKNLEILNHFESHCTTHLSVSVKKTPQNNPFHSIIHYFNKSQSFQYTKQWNLMSCFSISRVTQRNNSLTKHGINGNWKQIINKCSSGYDHNLVCLKRKKTQKNSIFSYKTRIISLPAGA